MEVRLKRLRMRYDKEYSIGHIYVDGKYVCDSIEDKDRGLSDQMTESEIRLRKIKTLTAIPTGRYQILLNVQSPKFAKKAYYKQYCNGFLPRLWKVKGYDGILIHGGRTEKDSAGCIVVGYNTIVGQVTDWKKAFEKLYTMFSDAQKRGEKIYITIEN